MNKNFNKDLLNEELKRFKLINEYTFYTGGNKEKSLDEADDTEEKDLNSVDNTDDTDINADVNKVGDELDVNVDDSNTNNPDDNGDENVDLNAEIPNEEPATNDMPDMNATTEPAPQEEEVELDVTQLVQGTEEAKQMASQNNQKMDDLLNKFNELTGKLNSMDAISSKIDNLEHQVEKRMPTPKEKLEMRSLDSYPYSLKLTDYWAEKDGQYDVMNNGKEPQKKEYILTKDDVNSDYNESNIKNSFDVNDNEFEEEEY